MIYIGEHLLPGQLGHFLVVLALICSLVASIAYRKANKAFDRDKQSWLRLGRIVFFIETIAVFGIFAMLLFIVSNHYNEYYFAWNHSSRSLQPEYLLSCIWEDQSGSFLLWTMGHCILGWIFIWRNKQHEAPVLTIVNFAQFCIITMLLGIYIGSIKIGANPFLLFRDQMPHLPIFNNPNYLSLPHVYEGNDLNTLLQNYWMVIHPPVLFLGFASVIIPFGFAYSGLINKDHSWTKKALPWALFSACVLGAGVMMGAAWAYESLSFGGYWAWDPVENASLVPWLTLIAGIHTNLIYKHSNYSLKSTYLFYIISFILILYSTFLTRSGVLGDTSVHAFAESGLNVQLYLLLNIFVWLPVVSGLNKLWEWIVAIFLFILFNILGFYYPVFAFVSPIIAFVFLYYTLRNIPSEEKEENIYSREFWMFIGALVLFLSALVIITKTSLPVFNKIFHTSIAPPEDVEFSYNQIQIFVAIILGVLTAITQYFKYKDSSKGWFAKKIALPTFIALLVSIAISLFGDIDYTKKGIGFLIAIHIAVFAAVYAVVANAAYIWIGAKGKLKSAGGSVAHVGFALMLAGILISSSKKTVLSRSTTNFTTLQSSTTENPAENTTLFKGIRTDMGKYHVTYVKDTFNTYDRKKYFELKFEKKNSDEVFFLYPDVLKNNKGMEGYSANPAARHYWNKDIFTYLTSWVEDDKHDTSGYRKVTAKEGDTLFYSNGFIRLNKISVNTLESNPENNNGLSMVFDMTVITNTGKRYDIHPSSVIRNNTIIHFPDTVIAQNLVVRFNQMAENNPDTFEIGIKEDKSMNGMLTLKVYEFPFINLLWLGIIVMSIGFVMSIIHRVTKKEAIKNLRIKV